MVKRICTLSMSFVLEEGEDASQIKNVSSEIRESANQFIRDNFSIISPGELVGNVYSVGVSKISMANPNNPN